MSLAKWKTDTKMVQNLNPNTKTKEFGVKLEDH